MDATTAFAVIPVTVGICTILHLLLEKRLRERIEFWKDQATQAEKQSPDVLAETLSRRIKTLTSELEELNKDRLVDATAIEAKETEIERLLGRIKELNEQMDIAKEVLEEYDYFKARFECPHCGAPAITISDEIGNSYECGFAESVHYTHPCPHDPNFPKLDEYELRTVWSERQSEWWCMPRPKTKAARALKLRDEFGRTEEEAKQKVIEQYRRHKQ